jgi:uncharacterized protein (TIGR00369 family)
MSAELPAHEALSPWQEPVRGDFADPSLFGLSGIEQLRANFAAGRLPPLGHLTGLRIVEIGVGTAVFEMPLSRWLCASQGAISIGPLTFAADAALGCAVQTGLPPATPFTTSELSLRVLSPAPVEGSVIATGRLVHQRRTISLSEVTLTDAHGRLIAHGSSLCFIQAPVAAPPEQATPLEPAAQPPDGSPDPYLRPPQGAILPHATWEERSGLEVLRALIAGELPSPPIARLTGLRLTAADEGRATFALPATEWLCAPPRGRVQGGAVALIAESALSDAIQTTLPRGTSVAPIDLKVNYLRPAASDGRELTAVGTLLHAGRRLAVANSEVRNADDKLVAVATGSAMLLQGRPASLAAVED